MLYLERWYKACHATDDFQWFIYKKVAKYSMYICIILLCYSWYTRYFCNYVIL